MLVHSSRTFALTGICRAAHLISTRLYLVLGLNGPFTSKEDTPPSFVIQRHRLFHGDKFILAKLMRRQRRLCHVTALHAS